MKENFNYNRMLIRVLELYDKGDYINLKALLNAIYSTLNSESPDDFDKTEQHSTRYEKLELYFQVSSLLKNKTAISDSVKDPLIVEPIYPPWRTINEFQEK